MFRPVRGVLGPSDRLGALLPPYSDVHPFPARLAGRPPDGLIVVVRVDAGADDGACVATLLAEVAEALPTVPRVLHLATAEGVEAVARAFRGGRLPACGLLLPGRDPAAGLRPALTAPEGLAPLAEEWLRHRIPHASPNLRLLLVRLLDAGAAPVALAPLLHRLGVAETTLRARLARRGLPAPSRWLGAARALQVALRIQADPDRPLGRVGEALGWAEPSAACHAVRRCFGVPPSALRGTLGVGWLLDRWAERSRLPIDRLD